MLAHRLPFPPHTGDKVRAYHVARHLAGQHQLTLACLADEDGAERAAAALRERVPDLLWARLTRRRQRLRALLALARRGSATLRYFDSPALRRDLAARCRGDRYDLVYVSSSSMAPYAGVTRAPVVMDFVDVDSDKWRQYGARFRGPRGWIYRAEARRLGAAEVEAARLAARCVVATEREAALLRGLAPWAPVSVVPNGVDLEYFAPPAAPGGDATIVFTGAMDYFPNVDGARFFAEWIFPRVRRAVPDARFVVVGKNPAPAVRRLATRPGVVVTGAVPDVRPYLGQAAVAVAPLRVARGVQNKVLEAMAMRRPVVATARAHEGLEARPGEDLLVEDRPEAFADAVTGLLRSAELREGIGRSARRFVERRHAWSASMAELDRLVDAVRRGPEPAIAGARRRAAVAVGEERFGCGSG
jgi:sugar transferase (PEP-CTERM/EpsH1 system associated)